MFQRFAASVSHVHPTAIVDKRAKLGANVVIMGEREIARSMADYARAKNQKAAPSAAAAEPSTKPALRAAVSEEPVDTAPVKIAP